MKQKKMLTLTFSQLKQIYGQEIPEIVEIADKSSTVEDFKAGILRLLETCRIENEAAEEAREQIRLLLDYDGQNVHELSTGQDMSVQTIRLLYEFLTGTLENMEMPTDLFIEIFQMFKRLKGEVMPLPSPQRIKSRNDRWETGLDEEVREIRDENKERMLHLLIQKIENRKSKPSVRFHFEEGMSYEEKYRLVSEWWNDFRFHLAMAVKSPGELNRFLGNSLSSETMYLLYRARKKGMPFFATPYYLSLLNITGYGYNDEAIRSYILYSPRLVETYGNIRAWEKEDIVEVGKPNAAGWLLPDGHNIHRRYPEVAILIPDTMGRACGGLCASCQRMYDFQSERLNFEFESLRREEVKTIYDRAAKEIGDVPIVVANDGDVTALAGYMSLDKGCVMGLAMGTSEAVGYVDAEGNILGWFNELAFAPVDLNEHAMRDEWSGDLGVGCKYFSQDAVAKLAPAAGIALSEHLTPAEKLKEVQKLAEQGLPYALEIFKSIGVYLAHTLFLYARFYDIRNLIVLGRVASGVGGERIVSECQRVRTAEYPALAQKLRVMLPDENFRRVGQSMAAASLPEV